MSNAASMSSDTIVVFQSLLMLLAHSVISEPVDGWCCGEVESRIGDQVSVIGRCVAG